ncbi:MAG: glycosyltransferase family 2 protein [Patescibacteria group bacterium]|nr:glycosyltransferase family 2 protein [Patescibacteria group bacterium]
MPRVSVNIVSWNSLKFLPDALKSLERQTFRDFFVVVVDNGSSDGSAEYVRNNWPRAVVIRNTRNLGFSRGHNQAIAYAKAHLNDATGDPLVLLTNPDIVLEPDCLERLVAQIDRRPKCGSVVPKLLKAKRDGDELGEAISTGLIDSAGMAVRRSLWPYDRGAGEPDRGQYDRMEEVFGGSGALTLFRLSALEDVAWQGECFDEDFLAYKEDFDLAWRLRLRGWSALYVPEARALHFRAAAGHGRFSLLKAWRDHRHRSAHIEKLSYRNHWLTVVKNIQFGNLVWQWPWIAFYEVSKTFYLVLMKPAALTGLGDCLRLLPRMQRKRHANLKRAMASAKAMRAWFR